MTELVIADFRDSKHAKTATGVLTDAGVTRQDLTLLTVDENGEEALLALLGDGELAARSRLEKRMPTLPECFQWLGLEQTESERLEKVVAEGGGVLVVSLPSGTVDAPFVQDVMARNGAGNAMRLQVLGPAQTTDALQIRTSVGDSPVQKTFVTAREVVTVERRPARRKADAADLEAFKDAVYTFQETREELVVEKIPYVTEEIVVNRERILSPSELNENVRTSTAEVEEL